MHTTPITQQLLTTLHTNSVLDLWIHWQFLCKLEILSLMSLLCFPGNKWGGGARELLLGGDWFSEAVRWRCRLHETCSTLQVSGRHLLGLFSSLCRSHPHFVNTLVFSPLVSPAHAASGVPTRRVISLCQRNARTSVRTTWLMTTSCCWTTAKR